MTRAITTPGRPALAKLPLTDAQKAYHRAQCRAARPAMQRMDALVQQTRALLTHGPLSVADLVTALHVTYDQAKWITQKLRRAGEIVPTDRAAWRLVGEVQS